MTAWIFTRAKELNFFEGQDRVSLGMLKTIGEFVTGYEVSHCPLKLWERAILEGYGVFRQIRDAEGGWVIGDRALRTIRYAPLEVRNEPAPVCKCRGCIAIRNCFNPYVDRCEIHDHPDAPDRRAAALSAMVENAAR